MLRVWWFSRYIELEVGLVDHVVTVFFAPPATTGQSAMQMEGAVRDILRHKAQYTSHKRTQLLGEEEPQQNLS